MQTQANYQIIGADGAEYGPVTLREMLKWVKEGRIIGSTQVRRIGEESWATASSFPELDAAGHANVTTSVPGSTSSDPAELEELEKRVKGGGSWFYWIAALTVINTVLVLAGANWTFVIGLTITQFIDIAVVTLTPPEFGLIAKGIVLVVDLAAAGFFVLLGTQALRKKTWAFVVGLTVYGLDTILTLLSFSVISIGIHGWALFCFVIGLRAAQQWNSIERETSAGNPSALAPSPDSVASVPTLPGQ